MTINKLDSFKLFLLKQYQIDLFLSIEEFENLPTSFLYKQLVTHKKDPFPDNYRFVFLNFSSVNKSTLDHVIKTLDYLDIPRFFVLIVSDQESTLEYFQQHTDISIKKFSDTELNTISKLKQYYPIFDNDHLCPHPWVGFHVRLDGTASVCCEYADLIKDSNGIPFNIHTNSFDEIFYSDYMTNLRAEFRANKKPAACATCWSCQSVGAENRFDLSKYCLDNVYGYIDWETEGTQSYIAGHFGNLCNLGCLICNPGTSSTIAAEDLKGLSITDKKKHSSYALLTNHNWSGKNIKFWDSLYKSAHQIKNFEFLGGEPLMSKENLAFIKHLVDTGLSKDSSIRICTNGMHFPDICLMLGKFKKAEITFSIDNLKEKFEYERYNSNWLLLEQTLSKFFALKKQHPSVKLNVGTAASILNAYDLPELITWIESKQFDAYYVNVVNGSPALEFRSLTSAAKTLILEKLSHYRNYPSVDVVYKNILSSSVSSGALFCDFIRDKDQKRNLNLLDSHNQIGEAMGYNT